MGREALLVALSWLSLSGTLAVNSFVYKDNDVAGSASRLYRHVPGAIYASTAPYGAYSFQPTFISNQKAAASRIIPVKETLSAQSTNGYLKDSYGNRFVEALQSMKSIPFKPLSQQYVQLQELPAHFAQPLSAAPVNFQYKQASPQIVVGSHYRLPIQSVAQSPINQYGFAHPGVYANSFKSLAPATYLNSFSSQVGPVIQLPTQASAPSEGYHSKGPSIQHFSQSVSENLSHPSGQHQSTSHNSAYTNTQPQEQYHHHIKEEQKAQRLQELPPETNSDEETHITNQQEHRQDHRQEHQQEHRQEHRQEHQKNSKLKSAPTKETSITTVVNGQKTVINLKTKPPLPLLDISLLEPLTFDNPLVPQVQHFLPRITEATYHTLPELNQQKGKKYEKDYVAQKTKSYDSGYIKAKPKKTTPKKKQKSPDIGHSYHDEYIPQATARPTVTVQGPNASPEISYEINSPNYKETYKEQAVKYNKETQSEPVHYTYGSNTKKEPVHYSYSHSSKEPVHIQEVRYEGKGKGPKHLIYNFKPEEQNRESEQSKTGSEDDSAENSDEDAPPQTYHHHQKGQHTTSHDASKSTQHHRPEHREQEYHHKPSHDTRNVEHHNVHQSNKNTHGQYHSVDATPFQPVAQYEEDIRLSAPIKVDPNQHVQNARPETPQQSRPSAAPQQHLRGSPTPQHYSNAKPHRETPSTHVQEKTKQVFIQEETPEDDDSVGEQLIKGMFGKDEDTEKEFENAYKNAAYGFPAYDKSSTNVEQAIFDPDSYGVPHAHSTYDIDHSPFQQYQEQGDEYPKEVRYSYKDDRDKTKEDYLLDYSVNKPESLLDRYKNKVNYYKLFKAQKPERYVAHEDANKEKKSEKFTAVPYSYYPVQGEKTNSFFAEFREAPVLAEYDYSKGSSKDNSAHASRPFQRLKMNTHFVEPQFQYGFEPVSIPRLLDSELAAMASNNSPESEKPGTRKKIYKENYYIKKTSMSDAGPNS